MIDGAPTGQTQPPDSVVERTRLDPFRSQRAFDVLMQALCSPGSLVDLPSAILPVEVATVALLPLALADPHTTVSVPDDARLERLVCAATGAEATSYQHAAMVAFGQPTAHRILGCRRGSPNAPEDGARVALQVQALSSRPSCRDDTVIELSGPGIPGARALAVRGLRPDALRAVSIAQVDRRAGIDVWLCSSDRWVAALPRSVTIRFPEEG